HLILEKGIKSHEILALTFTEKASREMEERVDIVMPYGYTQMWISTFHAFCDRILRNDAIHIGLTPGYRLMTQAESIKFFRDRLFQFELDYFRPLGNPTKFVYGMLQHFSRLRDEDISPEQYLTWVKKQAANRKTKTIEQKQELSKWSELAHAYQSYEKFKAKEGAMDFSDLISNTLDLFRKRPNVLGQYRRQFKHILVDEFQDTNIAQYELIKLLAPAGKKPNLTVVGDDSQSIYKFRGAAISNILSFMKDYKGTTRIVLNSNYRSTQTILDHSHQLIKHNDPDTLEAQMGISKQLIKTRKIQETDIELLYCDRVEDEAEEIVKAVNREIVSYKRHYKDFALLVRANNHADPFVRALRRYNIPYQFLGPGMLFRQEEVKDLIAYLKVLNDFEDSISFYRVLTLSPFNISARDIASLTNYAKKHNISLFESAEQFVSSQKEKSNQISFSIIDSSTEEKLGKLVDMIHRHMERVSKDTAGQILYFFLEDTGMIKEFAAYESREQEKRAQNISKFFDKLKTYEVDHEDASVSAVIDWIDLAMELGESPLANDIDWSENDAVNILTIHSSKGLEFPVVFLVNLTSGRFPTYERREQIPIPEELIKESLPEGDYHVQEERRLFYVGMTRACDRLYLSASKFYGEGKRERKISPFISEALGEKEVRNQEIRIKNKQLSFLDYKNPAAGLPTENNEKHTHPITYLSYSQIETFKFCPMHYKARYILKLPTPTYAAATYGTTMHQALRLFYERRMQGENMVLKGLIELFESIWNPIGFETKQHEQKLKALGKKQLTAFYTKHVSLKLLPEMVEKPFIFPVKNNLKFGGVIDRLDRLPDGRIEIIDYKTSAKVPTQKEVDKNLQLTLYALAATEVTEIGRRIDPENIVLSLFYFKDNVKLSTTRTREQLAAAQKEVIKIAEEIGHSDFKCSGTKWCVNCEFKMLCHV
ncbi:MAG: ATP-dependent helicase, partial [Candidatus Roizmanbacteria bacterium]|nr:ATP-dependent helicase [Candidatus Roizmanbacteria bacterium]